MFTFNTMLFVVSIYWNIALIFVHGLCGSVLTEGGNMAHCVIALFPHSEHLD